MPEYDSTIRYAPIPDFPGYAIGSDGSAWTCWSVNHNPLHLTTEWRQMKPRPGHRGHLRVGLQRNGRKHQRFIHHLVLEAFVGPRPPGAVCRHFPDRDPTNNRPENLRWGTYKENHADMAVHGTVNLGERHGRALLTEDAVRRIRAAHAAGQSQKSLAEEHGVHLSTVHLIVKGRNWKHLR